MDKEPKMASVQEAYFELISAVRNDEIPFECTNSRPHTERQIGLQVRMPQQVGRQTILVDMWIDDMHVDDLDSEFECRLLTYTNGSSSLVKTYLGSRDFGSPQSVIDGLSCFLCGVNGGRRAGIAAAQVSISKYMDRMEA